MSGMRGRCVVPTDEVAWGERGIECSQISFLSPKVSKPAKFIELPKLGRLGMEWPPAPDEIGPKKEKRKMASHVETREIHDTAGDVVGSYDLHFHLRRQYRKDGEFMLADGRKFNLRWMPKYSRNHRLV